LRVQLRLDLLQSERGENEAHPAVDVEADTAGRDHSVARIHPSHAADGKAVAPVGIGHGEAVPDDAGKRRDVRRLLEYLIVHRMQQRLAGEDPDRHAHARAKGRWKLPHAFRDLADSCWNHRHSPSNREAGGQAAVDVR
jgi:hypothetical protein